MDNYFDLGNYRRPITTTSPAAQTWFDRGLNWCYAFHHEEALRCFQKVIALDPNCAMAYWGLAYANGPNYNIAWIEMPPDNRLAVMKYSCENALHAQRLAAEATPVEQALCQAIIARFPAPHVDDAANDDIFAAWDDAYAQAMRDVYARFPHDTDVCALTAEALICRTPWQLWDLEKRVAAQGADTIEALTILETAFQRLAAMSEDPHPGLLHFYIHTLEMSPEPEKALQAADTLQRLVPDAGHLLHMPSHIYILCGQYDKVVEANVHATIADERYVAIDDTINTYTIYRMHNIHFQLYGAIFLGQYEAALRAANQLQASITSDGLHHELPWVAANLEAFYSMKAHVFVRFGKWQAIIAEPLPDDPKLFCVTTAVWQYAKGIAYAVLGDIEHAVEAQKQFREALARVPKERRIYNNESRDTLAIAEAMLAGELEYRRQNYAEAFAHLRRSVELYDNLNYAEPWAWMQPPRHALGALLLEQGYVAEASQVYRADLGLDDTLVRPSQHPKNIWSLHGYAECCRRAGHMEEAAAIQAQVEAAQAVADVTVNASCFCRQVDDCCH
jgi:tetratricopeptide (TPR) repeat protein